MIDLCVHCGQPRAVHNGVGLVCPGKTSWKPSLKAKVSVEMGTRARTVEVPLVGMTNLRTRIFNIIFELSDMLLDSSVADEQIRTIFEREASQ